MGSMQEAWWREPLPICEMEWGSRAILGQWGARQWLCFWAPMGPTPSYRLVWLPARLFWNKVNSGKQLRKHLLNQWTDERQKNILKVILDSFVCISWAPWITKYSGSLDCKRKMIPVQGLVTPSTDAKTEALKEDVMGEDCLAKKQLSPGLQTSITFYSLYPIPVTSIQQSLHL